MDKPTGTPGKNWSLEAYVVHNEAMRAAEEKFQSERDRRYEEVAVEREKALGIEKAKSAEALQLAREIQTYKDEKANQLREQINSERGMYATKSDLNASTEKMQETIKPIIDYVSRQQGSSRGMRDMYGWITAGVILGIALIGFFTTQQRSQVSPQVIYAPAPTVAQPAPK